MIIILILSLLMKKSVADGLNPCQMMQMFSTRFFFHPFLLSFFECSCLCRESSSDGFWWGWSVFLNSVQPREELKWSNPAYFIWQFNTAWGKLIICHKSKNPDRPSMCFLSTRVSNFSSLLAYLTRLRKIFYWHAVSTN